MCAYADADDVRRLSGNILNTEFSAGDVGEDCLAADSWINTKTQKSDWDSTDTQWKLILKVANKKATEFVLESYGQEFAEKVKDLRAECDALITDIIENMPADDAGSDGNIIILSSAYQSYPLSLEDDPEALPYISTTVNYTI